MHHLELLQDLSIVMVAAGLVTVLFHRFRQPVVLGYIVAGLIIGPYTPPFALIQNQDTIKTLAELGMILLMFSIGQHLHLRKLVSVGPTAIIGATLEIGFMIWVGYRLGLAFGWSAMDSLFLGAILSVSSTTIIAKALHDLGKTKERFAELIFGILIIEDILSIAMLVLLSSIATSGSLSVQEVLGTLGNLAVFFAMVLIVGLLIVPRFLHYLARYKNDEVLLVSALGICFGVSLIAALFHYSVALGAFLAGVLVAESRENAKIELLVAPVRDMFSAVFFVSIGMLIEPKLLIEYAVPTLVATLAVVLVKVPTCALGAFIAGNDTRTSFRVGMGLAQIGEFSFIIAQLGAKLQVTSPFLYPIVVTVSSITALLTPYFIKTSDRVMDWVERHTPTAFLSFLNLYHAWLNQAGQARQTEERRMVRQVLFKLVFPIALNIVFIASVFITAKAAGDWQLAWLQGLPDWLGGKNTVLWTAAMLAALPILLHTFLKLKPLSMALAELGASGQPRNQAAFESVIFIGGVMLISLWVLFLSLAIFPPWPITLILMMLLAGVGVLVWRHFNRVYSRMQVTIREALAESAQGGMIEHKLSTLLEDAQLESLEIAPGSPGAGRLIRELELRTRTGASVVGIRRRGQNIINPDPDEELEAGDIILLIGTRPHLEHAMRLLGG